MLLYFSAIAHLPVGVATLLNYTMPIFTAAYAAFFLGEAVRSATLGALLVTTVGVIFVITGMAPPGSLGFGLWQESPLDRPSFRAPRWLPSAKCARPTVHGKSSPHFAWEARSSHRCRPFEDGSVRAAPNGQL